MFGLLVAWKHMVSSSSPPLVYHAQNGQLVLVASGYAKIVEYRDVSDLLLTASGGTVYIVDACVPLPAVCKTLLITSPKQEVWSKWFRQYGPCVAYMPVPCLGELETCRSACYPSVSAERLLARACGGSLAWPREDSLHGVSGASVAPWAMLTCRLGY